MFNKICSSQEGDIMFIMLFDEGDNKLDNSSETSLQTVLCNPDGHCKDLVARTGVRKLFQYRHIYGNRY